MVVTPDLSIKMTRTTKTGKVIEKRLTTVYERLEFGVNGTRRKRQPKPDRLVSITGEISDVYTDSDAKSLLKFLEKSSKALRAFL